MAQAIAGAVKVAVDRVFQKRTCAACRLEYRHTAGVIVRGYWFCDAACRSKGRGLRTGHAPDVMTAHLEVQGLPGPKGSFRIGRRRGKRALTVRKDSAKTQTWHEAVALAASRFTTHHPQIFNTPLEVWVTFYLPRPRSHYNRHGQLLPSAPAVPAVKPDGDKLMRATMDALEIVPKGKHARPRGLFDGDSRIVDQHEFKRYASSQARTGAVVRVMEWRGSYAMPTGMTVG